jgi:mono/diheme cytochrome c family protein
LRPLISPRRESGSSDRSLSKLLAAALLLALVALPGCWEQVSVEWFPQMKWQPAVQAFEFNQYQENGALFAPPEGTVPVNWGDVISPAKLSLADQETIANPRPSTLASLKNGEKLFNVNCAACHGPTGGGNGPIAAPNGPIAGVLPIGPGSPLGFSLAPGLTDGHIYTTISLGRGRMPNYRRISPDGRWDVVNYIRDLNGQGGR